ncbi:hypothetical protein HDU79_009570 [Rhizoclosmatium sp. JEL0117]|nr:hypothetical protein HDU79_009570 [Rhizoclosmatium sp. JEL0117]
MPTTPPPGRTTTEAGQHPGQIATPNAATTSVAATVAAGAASKKSVSDAAGQVHASFVGTTLVFASTLTLPRPSSTSASTQTVAVAAAAAPMSPASLDRSALFARLHKRQLKDVSSPSPLPSQAPTLKAVRIDSVLGSGSFSYVYLAHEIPMPDATAQIAMLSNPVAATLLSVRNEPLYPTPKSSKRAVKRLFKESLDAKQLELQRHEIALMLEVGEHDNIVPLLGIVEDKKSMYLIMDCYEMDLYDAITKRGGFSDEAVKKIFGQIVDAVIHCHSRGVYHRDLKPENCLIVSASSAPVDYQIKLTDFGLATSDTWSSEMGCGSVRYMPPECFDPDYVSTNPNAKQPKDKKPNPFSSKNGYPAASSDVWSLGVMLVNLLFAKNPWFEAHPTDPIFSTFVTSNPNILRQQFNLSPHFDALLRRCFDLDPRRRCSVHDLKILVETMPRFTGGCVPGLIVPLGPGREMSTFKSHKRNISVDTAMTVASNRRIGGTLEEINDRHFKNLVPGVVLPPGQKIPAIFEGEMLELVAGKGEGHLPSPESTNDSLPSPTILDDGSSDKLTGDVGLYFPHQSVSSLSNASPSSNSPGITLNSFGLGPEVPSRKVSIKTTATSDKVPPSSKAPSVSLRFPSLRRHLSKSISGIQKTVKGLFGASSKDEQQEGAKSGFFRNTQEESADAFFKYGREKSEEQESSQKSKLLRKGSLNGLSWGRKKCK